MKLLKQVSKKHLWLAVFFSLLTGLDTLVIPVVVNGIIESVESAEINHLMFVTLYGIFGYALTQLGLFLWRKYMSLVQKEFSQEAKWQVFKYAINTHMPKEDVENIIYNDIPLLEKQSIEAWIQFVYCLWFSGISLIYVLSISWQVSLIFIAFSAIPILLPKAFEKVLKESSLKWSTANEALIKEMNEDLSAVSVMRHYKRIPYFLNRFFTILEKREEEQYQKTVLSYKVTFIINIFAVITGILPFGIGGYLAIKGYLSTGALVAVFLASDRVLSPLENAVRYWNDMQASRPLREKVEALIDASKNLETELETETQLITGQDMQLDFDQVVFGYHQPLFNLTGKLRAGDKVLIKGPSGAGKTTIFKTLFKEIVPLQGKLTINHQDIAKISSSELYQHIGYIPQEVIVFDDTILFNLTLGEKYSEDTLYKVIQESGLDHLISTKGLDYQVGPRGENLSGGERARLTVARALLRNYPVLLVDEFSSSLDKETAQKIREVLLKTDKIVLEIAHHYDDEDVQAYDYVWSLKKDNCAYPSIYFS